MDWASIIGSTIGGLFGAGGTALSNKGYLQGVKDTNATNLQIARETNAQNLAQFNAANSFTREMWDAQNAYNNPAAVRARLIRAGISPAAMAEGGLSASVQSVAGSPSQAAVMQAPDLVGSPLSSLGNSIGGAVRDYYNNELLKEQVKQSKYASEMKLMDKSFYYDEKVRRLRQESASIYHSDLDNKEKEMRLSQLADELRHASVMRNKLERAADDEHDNAVRVGSQIESETDLNRQRILESIANISHMSETDRIAWFNARSNAQLSAAQARMASETANKLIKDISHSQMEFDASAWRRHHQRDIDELDFQERQYAAMLIAMDYNRNRQKYSGFTLNGLIREVLGVDVENIFSSGVNLSRRFGQ